MTGKAQPPRRDERLDRLGAVASGLCAVHCAAAAVLPTALGALGLGFVLGQGAEWAFTLLAVVLAGAAMVTGWRRHRSVTVMVLMTLGVVGLLVSRGLEMGGHHGDHHGHHAEMHASLEPNPKASQNAHDHRDSHNRSPATHHENDGGVGEDGEGSEEHHMAGAAVGIIAGLLLVGGHVLGIRKTRCCVDEACA